jgi:hypothetical protein
VASRQTFGVRHRITKVLRADASYALPGLADFELGPAEDVADLPGDVAPWGLDVASGRVILLDFADAVALRAAMFVYQAQVAQATSVYLVPYADFAADDARPPVFLHSVGRCGSTLLAQRLALIPGVCCLSEPGIYSAVQSAVETGALDGERATAILRTATNWLARTLVGDDTLVVKTRGEDCRIWPLFDAAFPESRSLFLYRDAVAVVQSFDRILGYPHGRTQALPERDALFERQLPAYEAALRTRFFARTSPDFPVAREACGPWAGLLLAEWIHKVKAYLAARERASDRAFALRYDDLADDGVLPDLAAFLGHTWPDGIAPADADSQEGTPLEAAETLVHPLDAATKLGIDGAGRAILGHAFPVLPGSWPQALAETRRARDALRHGRG